MAVGIWFSEDPTSDEKKLQDIALQLDRGTYRPSAENIAEAVMRYLRKIGEPSSAPQASNDDSV